MGSGPSWKATNIALLVMECVVSIHPDVFQSADWVIDSLLLPIAWLSMRSAVPPSVPLDSGLPAMAIYFHQGLVHQLHWSCKKTDRFNCQ